MGVFYLGHVEYYVQCQLITIDGDVIRSFHFYTIHDQRTEFIWISCEIISNATQMIL